MRGLPTATVGQNAPSRPFVAPQKGQHVVEKEKRLASCPGAPRLLETPPPLHPAG